MSDTIVTTAGFVQAPESLGTAAPYVRVSFGLDELPASATLKATALGIVEPWLNGSRVGDQVLAPGWTSYTHRVLVSSYDVTETLRPGENVVGAVVGNGWACGRLGFDGARGIYRDRPAVLLELELIFADGSTRIVATGPEAQVATGAILSDDLYAGEHVDARLEPQGWSDPGFDASGWVSAEPVEWDLSVLEPMVAPPVRRIETLRPVGIHTTPSGARVVDFGQIITGWVRASVTGDIGTKVTLRHAELTDRDGEIDITNLRTAQATDSFVLAGAGQEAFEPRFTFHGFRYVEITGWPGELAESDLEAVVLHSDMRRTGWLETSDELLNQFHANIVWGMRGNFVAIPTDCPQRDERLGWTGDLNAFAPSAAFLYDIRGVLGSWLTDLLAEQRQLGSVPWYVPQITGSPSAPAALWSDVVVNLPWVLHREYGDIGAICEAYPGMQAFLAQVEQLMDDRGVWSRGYQFGDWLDPDAPDGRPDKAKASAQLVATAYLYRSLGQASDAARIVGDDESVSRYTALAAKVRDGFAYEFLTPAGRLADESPTSYALAIRFGLVDGAARERAGALLAERVAGAGFTIATGFAGTPHILDALVETGHEDVALRLLMQTKPPSFLYPVTMGATTVWERWDAIRPDGTLHPSPMTSLNHYALGAVSDWMHRRLGGLEALEPGYARVRVAPLVGGGVTSARLVHDTVAGRFEVSWEVTGVRGELRLTVPDGSFAEVALPAHPEGLEVEVGPGEHSWEYEFPVEAVPEFSLDSTVADFQRHPQYWRAVFAALKVYIPHLPDDMQDPPMGGPEMSAMPLRAMLSQMPRSGPAMEADVQAALDAVATA